MQDTHIHTHTLPYPLSVTYFYEKLALFLFIGHNKKRLRGMTREIKWPVIGMRNKKASFILYARGNIVFFTL